jgi:hypothetical protein
VAVPAPNIRRCLPAVGNRIAFLYHFVDKVQMASAERQFAGHSQYAKDEVDMFVPEMITLR